MYTEKICQDCLKSFKQIKDESICENCKKDTLKIITKKTNNLKLDFIIKAKDLCIEDNKILELLVIIEKYVLKLESEIPKVRDDSIENMAFDFQKKIIEHLGDFYKTND